MRHSPQNIQDLQQRLETILPQLQQLQIDCVGSCQGIDNQGVKEYMLQGAGRRLSVLHRSLQNVSEIFPPSATTKLELESLIDVQINMHAFFINLIGVFDNWAWCFVYRHNLEEKIGKYDTDMFKKQMQCFLPDVLREYLTSERIKRWHSKYLKDYRDSLAHRVPLYIPPAHITPEDNIRYERLWDECLSHIQNNQWEQLNETVSEQESIGTPCFVFLLSASEDSNPPPVVLHPQMLADAATAIEFGRLFLAHWHNHK